MQDIHIEKPYDFVPPHRGSFLPGLVKHLNLLAYHLKKADGVDDYEIRHVERLRKSLDDKLGVLLTPNHCRTADPLLMGWVTREANCLVYAMASWHLFNQNWFEGWAIRILGGFSVNREGVDRKAINTAIEVLEEGDRPLVIFPEGTTTRTNDRLHALLDGVAFIARSAAKKRKKSGAGKVVVHPVAIKYLFGGDLRSAVDPVLADIEHRLSWQPQADLPLIDRIRKVGLALLCLKELEYFDAAQKGSLHERLERLINRLLHPLEEEWLGESQEGPVVPRVRSLRIKIMPDMVNGELNEGERDRRWRQLTDLYLAQQVSCYPPDYLTEDASVDRILETVERFEEDLSDKARVHGQLKAVIDIGEPIEVSTERDRKAKVDPLMVQIEKQLSTMLEELALESPIYKEDE